ncbi:hypothetical protein BDR03DRAFT_988094, partial [Suillus americanus]
MLPCYLTLMLLILMIAMSSLMNLMILRLSTIHTANFLPLCSSEDQIPCNNSPWEPFQMRLDFKVAEIALEAAMTEEQTNRLFDLEHRSTSGKDIFTLQSHDEFQKDVVSVKHQDETYEFDMHYRPLWDWALDLLQDSHLAPHCIFDTQFSASTGRKATGVHSVAEDQKHTKKKSFIDFKNAVWHSSFYQLLQSIELHSKTGYWFELLILSGDYEEHCNSQQVLYTAREKHTQEEKEEALKAYSLRNVEDHLWKEVLFWISDLGWEAATKLDANFDALPRWPNLTHFKTVKSVDFNDGSLHEDISKTVKSVDFNDGSLHEDISKDILCQSQSKLGYLLLPCIHYYIELDIYASFKVHTEETIAAGRVALDKFLELMESQPETNKSWNFPKKHMITHIFDDILAKGVTCNYNTKPNEKMHGPLWKIYLQRTNFKDVAPRILRYDHWLLTSTSMRTNLDELDNYNQKATDDPETNETLDELVADPIVHVHLGSKQGKHSFSDIMDTHGTDRAFTNFQTKLNGFLNVFLPQNGIPLPD